MKAVCGKCKARINVNTQNIKTEAIRFKCPVCSTINKLDLSKVKRNEESVSDKTQIKTENNLEDVMGWIVVHDENTQQQTYSLKKGKNIIGRKSESKPCDVAINTSDKFMSRNHLAIEISHGINGLDYLVYDVTSTNGTFINANEDRKLGQSDKVYLRDGDTIQAGRTKMVLRTKKMAGTARNATNTVINSKPLKTIIVG